MNNMFTSPDASSTWMQQFIDPNTWQAWLSSQRNDMSPLVTTMNELGAKIDPAVMAQLQKDYVQELTALWQNAVAAKMHAITDRRFTHPEWQSNSLHSFNAAAYLLNARFLTAMADAADAAPKAKQKIRFAVQQIIDAMSPANFLATNPEAQQKILETQGESLTRGIANLLADIQKGKISQTDDTAFEVGKNVATTEGAVVFENELFQLLQYKPLTKKVFERPMLIVPPCINKYYILDLQPDNSLVRYAVEQGHTVFLISWCNPDISKSKLRWSDYIQDGVVAAISVARDISGQDQINTFGFCIGGTLLATALAVLAAHGDSPASSVTLLTTLLDFTDAGVIDVFIDEAQVSLREQMIGQGGLMPGRDFTSTFSSLRPNDLVWNYVNSNYLKGENPRAFDLLYWNADATNLPGPMFCWYLRNLYLENNLKEPGKLSILGQKLDLSAIDAPAFIFGSREDHIVPWTAAYESMALLNPKKRKRNKFVLGASGHIAGVINAPAKNKRSYWINDQLAANAEEWKQGAEERAGSWWPAWGDFLAENAGALVAAPRKFGNEKYKSIEPAPGRYVRVKAQ